MRLLRRVLVLALLALLLGVAVVMYFIANPNLPTFERPKQLHYLEQWSPEARQTYYYTPQGTQVKGLQYDWFTALERPFSHRQIRRIGLFGPLWLSDRSPATAQQCQPRQLASRFYPPSGCRNGHPLPGHQLRRLPHR